MNPEFVELLEAFADAEVRFLVAGTYALAWHARPRAAADLDLWVEPTAENAKHVFRALDAFGAPLDGVTPDDFTQPGLVFRIGLPPRQIDIRTERAGLEFREAWEDRVAGRIGPCQVNFLGKRSLIKNKRAMGRPQDLADLAVLEGT